MDTAAALRLKGSFARTAVQELVEDRFPEGDRQRVLDLFDAAEARAQTDMEKHMPIIRGEVTSFEQSGKGFPAEGGDWSRCSHGNQFLKVRGDGTTAQKAFEAWRDAFMATFTESGPNTVCWRKRPEIERGRMPGAWLRSWKVVSRHCVCKK